MQELNQNNLPEYLKIINSVQGGFALKEAEVLFNIARSVKDGCIVEIGSYRGKSTVALCLGSKQGAGVTVYAIDPHEIFEGALGGKFGPEDRKAFFHNMINTGCYETVRLINLPSEKAGSGWCDPISFLWIDGDHRYEIVRKDVEVWEPHVVVGGTIAFHDSVNPSLGPNKVISEILSTRRFRIVKKEGLTTVLEKIELPIPDSISTMPNDDVMMQHVMQQFKNIDGMAKKALELPVNKQGLENEPFGKVKISSLLSRKLMKQLCDFIDTYFRDEIGLINQRDLEKDIIDFYRLLKYNPALKVIEGATVDGLNIWLHLIVRQLMPQLIVESGVGFGRSLYTLRTAAERAELHAFDISFLINLYKEPSIIYYENDWSKSEVTCSGIGFCYFDDHINNGRRIREAYEKGFTHLIFDQCAPVGMVHLYRYPGLPSAVMIGEDTLNEGDEMEWVWEDQKIKYRFEREHTFGAEELIDVVKPLPNLERWTGKGPGQAAYVRLKQNIC